VSAVSRQAQDPQGKQQYIYAATHWVDSWQNKERSHKSDPAERHNCNRHAEATKVYGSLLERFAARCDAEQDG
jgi:hypothetical protein